ncbi:alpha/beta-hydrolase [Rhizoclosmatium globosum]|uniref:Alpha/beta-hydrolase n=1 Tax=Rhizoclosmatium globosum TaxID=329046 RepID=A0A1Y2D2D2_9FUNG|nr:alpha/beta-hydrolase [Rhizoclosmatium globosum]|eukprot:ORY53442.1 alpha/beta-hydrolase [Rhizoclosmatium globosum]
MEFNKPLLGHVPPSPKSLKPSLSHGNRIGYLAFGLLVALVVFVGCLESIHPEPVSDVKDPFKWQSCPGKDKDYKCGRLKVPLDYTKNHSKTIDIAVAVYKAQVQPSLGTITFNFGGPGGPGKASVLARGPSLSVLTGGRYDILGFDPRGIGESVPITCFESATHHAQFDVMASMISPPTVNGPTSQVTSFAALQEAWAKSCAKWAEDILPHMSTTQVSRDLDEIRKALGDSVLNYYGFSYGTMLGTVYTQMFPNNVGRMIIDGVMNPLTYMGGPIFKDTPGDFVDTEELFEAFGKECDDAGPSRCALAVPGSKTTTRIRDFAKQLEHKPLVVVDGATVPFVIHPLDVLQKIYGALYRPAGWPAVAKTIAKAIAGDGSDFNAEKLDACPIKDESGDNGMPGVTCLDTFGNQADFAEWEKAATRIQKVSPTFGVGGLWSYLVCKFWQVQPSERFTGPWNHKLKNQILIIGNTLDIITPISNARTVERIMEGGGVLLHHDGYGHCSTAHKSTCTLNYIKDYFNEGTLPEKGTVCKVDPDVVIFPEPSLVATKENDWLNDIHDVVVAVNLR